MGFMDKAKTLAEQAHTEAKDRRRSPRGLIL
ncbi:MAG: hypothetical protein JWQ20_1309 [Conexibacter sp.]|jgi:hypothetical protein|nr:hypothetical protein [Conexibacter sp.]